MSSITAVQSVKATVLSEQSGRQPANDSITDMMILVLVRSIEEPNQPKNYIDVEMNKSMEPPGKDASAAEKARYLEDGFWDSYAEGIDESDEDSEVEDQSKESN